MTTGVILDSGDVLIRPVTGQWFPPPAFASVLATRGITWEADALAAALEPADAWLDEIHAVPLADEEAELPVWVQYHELLLDSLGVDGDRRELAEAITAEWQRVRPVELFAWTVPVLRELQARGIPVVILSDAWPSLRRWYRELEIDVYVGAMVISAEEGITKPDRRAYDKARSLVDADDVVFVDDAPGNVHGAIAAGLRGLRLRHPGKEPDAALVEITDLADLLAHL